MALLDRNPAAAETTGKRINSMPSRKPFVSIIIPMRNEEKYISKCLQSVLSGEYPESDYEILVVDGSSTDRSREIVESLARVHPSIVLLHNPAKVVPPAMNIGLRIARGEYIVRMDAHSEYPPDYVRCCVEELERTGAANVGGRWITRPGSDTWVAKAIALLTQSATGVGNAHYRLGQSDRYVDTVPFGAYRRELFAQVGLFREDLVRHQDYELNARIRHAGGRIFLSSRVYNTYYNVPTVSKFMRQGRLNGVWVARCWRRYPVSFCVRHAAPLGLVGALAVPLILATFYPPFLNTSALLAATYLALAIATGLRAAKVNWRYGFLVPLLMVSYHITYGVGTLWGLLTPRLYERDDLQYLSNNRLARCITNGSTGNRVHSDTCGQGEQLKESER